LAQEGLLNGLVLVHPPLLFTSYALSLVMAFVGRVLGGPLLHGVGPLTGLRHTLAALGISILLGGVWAQHELNWGGW
jgi:cytochrome c biogenesis factor